MEVPHQGGLRFEKTSDYYKTIYNWIAPAFRLAIPTKDAVAEIQVEPKEIFMQKPGETATVKVVAKYMDGVSRDVTRETTVESNIPDVATVDPKSAQIKGERTGEATLLVRYQGKLQTIPVTVLNPKPGSPGKRFRNTISSTRRLTRSSSGCISSLLRVADDATFLRRVSLDLTGQIPSPSAVRAFLSDPAPTHRQAHPK